MLSVIIPYRRRRQNLENLIGTLRETLRGGEWELVVVELVDGKPFNHGLLDNAGFSVCTGNTVCFHDVDMLPVLAEYSPEDNPVCLLASCNLYGGSIPYETYFGGVTLFTREQYLKVNGYSNLYLGWGASDDDMWVRCERAGFRPGRKPGVFHHQEHPRETCRADIGDNHPLLDRFIRSDPERQWCDGFTSARFSIVDKYSHRNSHVIVIDYDVHEYLHSPWRRPRD